MKEDAPLLDVQNLSVTYRAREGMVVNAVRDVTFSLGSGEGLGLVGESGSGKSTIAMAVVRYLRGNGDISGLVRFDGHDLAACSKATLRDIRGRRIGIVYQDPATALNPTRRVGYQVADLFRLHSGASRREARESTEAMLARVQLPDPSEAWDRLPHEYSGGQRQRIVIAMALATNPDLLILDEPTTGLDVTVQAEMVQLFADLRASTNAAMLFISHNVGLVAQVCERIAVMYAGEIVDSGPTLQVLSGPTHPYTRALLSSIIPLGATKHDLTLASLEGSAPRGEVRGCAFSPRCVMATPQCETDHPALIAVDAERSSRCWCQSGPMSLEAGTRLSLTPETTSMATDAVLEVRGLSKTFEQGERQVAAVVDVSFSVSRGRILGVVGESGCGKTTTARIVAGLSEASEGHVILDGTDATRLVQHRPNEMRRLVQMVFQDPDATLNPKHTVRRALRRTVRRLTDLRGEALERRVEEVARAMRLEPDQVDSLPSQLSGGQQQRAALARAFASDPDLILCDEPTSALDVSVQAAILNLIVDLQRKRDASYMFISHDLAAVRYVADEMAVMYLGGIVEIGPASRVFTPPVHPYTEVLLSATVMTERIKLPNVEMTLGSRPTGCPFHPRCPRKVGPECETALPPWQATDNAHRYRCVIAPGELKKAQAMFNLSASSMPGPPGPDALI